MTISLVITTYNRPDALDLVLKSVMRQKKLPTEIVIADDGSDHRTASVISKYQNMFTTPIIHSWQDDKGFRAAQSRNLAISKTQGEYIILIDGDMILNPNFIDDHFKNAQIGFFIQGKRVLLSKKLTLKVLNNHILDFSFLQQGISNRQNMIYSNSLSRIFRKESFNHLGIKTCNMSFFKKDFLLVNGFDNNFIGWGREDSELINRFFNAGIKRIDLRFSAIQFHLFHQEDNRNYLLANEKILQESIKERRVFCKNGVSKFL